MEHLLVVAVGGYAIGALTWYSICSIKMTVPKKVVKLCTYPGAEPCDNNCSECNMVMKIEV